LKKRYEGNVGLPTSAAATAATAITAAATTFVATATAAAFIAAATAATFVAATTTTTAAVATTTESTTTWAGFFWLGCVHAQRAAVVVILVKGLDGRVQLGLVTECHEGEAFGLAGLTVGDDFDPFDRSKSGEEAGDVSFSSGVGQVAHVNVHLIRFF